MKTVKIALITFLGVVFLIITLIGSVILTATTTSHLLPFYLRQVWHDVSPHEPDIYQEIKADVVIEKNVIYPSVYGENTLDIYYAKEHQTKRPTILWIHGGAFVSGSKNGLKVFGSLLASHGYTVISMNYELAPERHYPGPLIQVSEVITFLEKQKLTYPMIDLDRLVIGGDSAGAHIAANFAVLQTNPMLSEKMEIDAVLTEPHKVDTLLWTL